MGLIHRRGPIPEQSLNKISDILLLFLLNEPPFEELPQGVQLLIAEFAYGQGSLYR